MMTIISQILICLLLAGLLGAIIGWLLRSLFVGSKTRIETVGTVTPAVTARSQTELGDLTAQLRQTVHSRDKEIEGLKAQIVDFDALRATVQKVESRLSEYKTRCQAIAQEKDAEIAALRKQLKDFDEARATTPAVPRGAGRRRRKIERDDLKLINGVGPVLEKFLHRLGIYRFRDVARWTDKDIDRVETKLPEFRGRIRREKWVASARAEYLKKYGKRP
jgi:predicted flap endonuclease-1-like 5' DNA nuclease